MHFYLHNSKKSSTFVAAKEIKCCWNVWLFERKYGFTWY